MWHRNIGMFAKKRHRIKFTLHHLCLRCGPWMRQQSWNILFLPVEVDRRYAHSCNAVFAVVEYDFAHNMSPSKPVLLANCTGNVASVRRCFAECCPVNILECFYSPDTVRLQSRVWNCEPFKVREFGSHGPRDCQQCAGWCFRSSSASSNGVRERGFEKRTKMICEEGRIWITVDIGVVRRCGIVWRNGPEDWCAHLGMGSWR